MGVTLAILGAAATIVVLMLAGRRHDADETPPLFVEQGRCPACGHPVDDHTPIDRLTRVRRGCRRPDCGCDVAVTPPPWPI
ncbi:MAG: hypothetical protein RIB65_18920 [Ilumatobacter fluminis]|uniref:hypothetical protein n=1 Tax=Ilumatobacter fluminis TaxID=467091 RepID=UPI00105C03A6|nr:hypothetical protein [Ilumatobacter fluminis]